jgi:hypothetical protein
MYCRRKITKTNRLDFGRNVDIHHNIRFCHSAIIQSIPIPISIICAFDFGKFIAYKLQNSVHWYNSKHVSSDPETSF